MNPSTAATQADPQRRRRRGSEELRVRLLEAALAEFAEHGYDGASTRAIAGRAGAHQPQINYHFHSKLELWRAAVDYLMDRLDEALAGIDGTDAREAMAGVIRGLVLFAAEWPELNRIMIQEGTAESERLTWIVDRHVRHRHARLVSLWTELVEQGRAAPVSPMLIHYLLVGSASLLYANAPEARLLLGIEPTDPDLVTAHADTLVDLLLPVARPLED